MVPWQQSIQISHLSALVFKDTGHWSKLLKIWLRFSAELELTQDCLTSLPAVTSLHPVTKRANETICPTPLTFLSAYLQLKGPTDEAPSHSSHKVLGSFSAIVNVNKGQRPQKIEMFFYILELFFDKLYIFLPSLGVTSVCD